MDRGWLRFVAHVFAASSFAVAQPLFDLLGRNATFFVAQRAQPVDIVVVGLVLVLVPALVVVGLVRGAALVLPRAAAATRAGAIGMLVSLAVVPPIVRGTGAGMIASALAYLVAGALASVLYARVQGVDRLLTWLSPAPLAFLALFFVGGQIRGLLLPDAQTARAASAGTGAPVIVLTFDEFSLIPLIKPDGSLDSRRFPNFGRLAARGTWFPGATTVHYATDYAIPASLSGTMPTAQKKVPAAVDHPDTLFSLLGGRYELRAYETVSQLCPRGLCADTGARPAQRSQMLEDIGIVYLHFVLPRSVADRVLPSIGDRWVGFGAGETVDAADQAAARPTTDDLRGGAGYESPVDYFERFLSSIERPTSPTLWYLHTLLPHKPWRYLPDGVAYEGAGHHQPGWTTFRWDENEYLTNQAQQRYVLQVLYVDALLGRLLDRLEDVGLYDRALVIVYADHGIGFRPTTPPRRIVPDNVAEILPVPLFVKEPGQMKGRVDRRNAQIIDVLPTIADVLGLAVPWRVDGHSLVGPDPKISEKYCFNFDGGRSYPARIPGVLRRSAELRELFGGSLENMYAFGPNAHLVGRRVASLEVGQAASGIAIEPSRDYGERDPDDNFLPARFAGLIEGVNARPDSAVAVAVGGTIAGVGKTFWWQDRIQVSVMLDPVRYRPGAEVDLFLVGRDGRTLRPVEVAPVSS